MQGQAGLYIKHYVAGAGSNIIFSILAPYNKHPLMKFRNHYGDIHSLRVVAHICCNQFSLIQLASAAAAVTGHALEGKASAYLS